MPSSASDEVLLRSVREALSGRYEIREEIGRGGMATVFLALDRRHDRRVAIKVLQTSETHASYERFFNEIRIIAGFSHPHILPLLDSGIAGEFPYYVMPYVEGESLRERLARERLLPLEDVVRLTREVAEALDLAHRHGVIHRDIKPANILLEEGHAVVADFGLVKAIDALPEGGLTGTGIVVGTPTYMSPEQASGESVVDERSDLYSLACVVFEMLAGDPPFTASSTRALISKKLTQPVPPLTIFRESLPSPVDRVLKKALAPVAADRYRTAGEFATALEACVSSAEETGRSSRVRNPRRLVLAGLLLVVAIGLGYRILKPPQPPLSDNKVVVFPLNDAVSGSQEGLLWAGWIQGALEHAGTLKLVDGWSRLDPAARADISTLSPVAEREVALAEGARYYIGGRLIPRGDSLHVFLRVHDARGDTVVAQATGAGPSDLYVQVGFETLTQLFPAWLDPGRRVDLSPVQERDPGAVVAWIHGERAYRLGRFLEARDDFRRAVAADSLFAFAALKGALAANWLEQAQEATSFIELAMRHAHLLPPKHRLLAEGLAEYWAGDADASVTALRRALEEDPEWPEAWMALAEAYLHLIPSDATDVSTSWAAFDTAWALDPAFTPPLIHLAEIELREGDVELGSRLVSLLAEARPNEDVTAYLALMRDCVHGRLGRRDWDAAATLDPGRVLSAAKRLSEGGSRLECAEAAFRSLWEVEGVPGQYRWAGALGLTALYVARARFESARAVLDSAEAWVGSAVQPYVIVAALAGAPLEGEARQIDEILSARNGIDLQGVSTPARWALTAWRASQGDTAGVRSVVHSSPGTPEEASDAGEALALRAMAAHEMSLLGESQQALDILSTLAPVAHHWELTWDPFNSFPLERLLRARLLLDQGRPAEALRVAAVFDHPAPIVFLEFLPASLALRREAALAMDSISLASGFSDRLEALQGRADPPHPNTGGRK